MPEIHGYTIFCDDIRQEMGGKLSYMGTYNGSLHILQGQPTTLPKLAISMTIVVPEGVTVSEPITFALIHLLDGNPTELLRAVADGADFPVTAQPGRVIRVSMNFQLSPFLIDRDSALRARAYVNGDEIKIGTLSIHLGPPSEGQSVDTETRE